MNKLTIKILILLFIGMPVCFRANGQELQKKISFGIESEVMSYINKGYHGSFWVGINGVRSRFVYAQATYPSSFAPKGFKNFKSRFYEVEIDVFFGKKRKEYRGLWYALGLGFTKQSVESETTSLKGNINLFDIHTGAGYAIGIYKGLYINPWVGLDIHTNPKSIEIGNEVWKPHIIDPVGGAKIGYRF